MMTGLQEDEEFVSDPEKFKFVRASCEWIYIINLSRLFCTLLNVAMKTELTAVLVLVWHVVYSAICLVMTVLPVLPGNKLAWLVTLILNTLLSFVIAKILLRDQGEEEFGGDNWDGRTHSTFIKAPLSYYEKRGYVFD